MRRRLNEGLLREYVKSVLTEDDAGGNPAYGGGGIDASGPYGVSFGSGEDLISTFVSPFVDLFKTAVGQAKEITRRAGTVLNVALRTVLTTLIPIYGYDYSDVFAKEEADLKKIREQYKDVYARTDAALASSDAGMLAFMASPALVLGYKFGKTVPPAAAKETKELLSALTSGFSDKVIDNVKAGYEKAGKWAVGDAGETEQGSSGKKGSKSPGSVFPEGRLLEKSDGEKKKGVVTLGQVLANKKFLDHVMAAPEVQRMQKQAEQLYKRTLTEVYEKAENLLKNAKTVEDLEKAAKGKLKGDMKAKIEEVKKLPPEEKAKAEKMLVDGVRKAMKDFYTKNLTDHVKKVIDAGIPESAPYVKDYKSVIQKIQAL